MKFYKYLYIGDTVKDPAKAKRKLKCENITVWIIFILKLPLEYKLSKSVWFRL